MGAYDDFVDDLERERNNMSAAVDVLERERDQLRAEVATLRERTQRAEKKAEVYERDWYASKIGFGDAIAKARARYRAAEAEVERLRSLRIVFAGRSHGSLAFVDVERDGESVSVGTWTERPDGKWELDLCSPIRR